MRIDPKVVLAILVALLGVMLLSGMGQISPYPAMAARAVQAQGFTDPVYKGMHISACAEDETGFLFAATNANGVRVNLVACGQMPFPDTYGWTVRSR